MTSALSAPSAYNLGWEDQRGTDSRRERGSDEEGRDREQRSGRRVDEQPRSQRAGRTHHNANSKTVVTKTLPISRLLPFYSSLLAACLPSSCQSVRVSVRPSVRPPARPSVRPPVRLSARPLFHPPSHAHLGEEDARPRCLQFRQLRRILEQLRRQQRLLR